MTPRTLSEIAELCGATLTGDGARVVSGPASLAEAGPDEISFLTDRRYLTQLAETRAAAVLVREDVEVEREGLALLVCDDPGRAFSRVILAFAPEQPSVVPGVHASAVVDASAEIASDASVGPLCVVGPGVRIASGAVLHPNVTIGAGVDIGPGTVVHPGAVLYAHVRVGARCLIHAGAVLGADGFGFEPTPNGWEKTPQAGTVVLEDDVEVGANVTIDCARFGATRIGRGVKIDNLVHLAHNVQVGEGAMFLAQSAVSGSTRVGRGAIFAGKAACAGHLEIGAGARLGGASAVFKDVAPGEEVFGVPAGPKAEQLKNLLGLKRVAETLREVRELKRRVEELEAESGP
ncbi:MAG: UDP-3-O-(3-hydroxymyristoyl)glucosamine N-acyltransferase [bacterium]|nr:UDP-3-O-(3-hydroxymyristoyl)glucosamine N-acyltransferase [bacterium]